MFGIPFGTAPYGGIPYVPPSLPAGVNVLPVRQNGIFVRFAAAVTQSSPLDILDALNPDNYSLSASGIDYPPKVVEVLPGENSREVELRTSPSLDPGQDYDLTISRVVVIPITATISGPQKTARRGADRARRDLATPVTTAGISEAGGDVPNLGTFVSDGKGDYALGSRIATLRKRIYRILVCNPGSLPAHPEFGVGIERYKSQKMTTNSMSTISGDIKRQLTAEPDIRQVSVSFDYRQPTFIIYIRVRTTDGIDETFDYAFDWEK